MNIAKQLEALRAKRTALMASLESLVKLCEEESRTFTPDEQKNFDGHKEEVTGIDAQIERLEAMLKMAGASAEPVKTDVIEPASRAIVSMKDRPKGLVFTRYVMALAASRGNLMQAVEISKGWKETTPEVETILKSAVAAGSTTGASFALELAPYQVATAEFIELLRSETLLGKVTGFRKVPFHIRVQRQTAGVTAGWVGEGALKPVSAMAFDSFTIPATKMAVIVVLTEELVRFSNPSAEAAVQQELVMGISEFMDGQFINPLVSASAGVNPGSITNGAASDASQGITLDQVTGDMTTAMGALVTGNIPMRNRYWIMNPRTALYLMTLRVAASGVFAFRDEMVQGRLMGIPFLTSNAVPIVSGDTIITLLEASEIYLADDGQTTIDISREASVTMDTEPMAVGTFTSLWQANLVGIRAERYAHWLRRRAAAVHVTTGVAY